MRNQNYILIGWSLRLLGFLISAVGVIIGLICINFFYNSILSLQGQGPDLNVLVFSLIGAAICAYFVIKPGRFLIKRGKQLLLKAREEELQSAIELADEDDRPPVLYLRSFAEDESKDELTKRYQSETPWDIIYSRSKDSEQQIRDLFSPLGPFVCIGDPREKLPKLGAVRMYYRSNDDTWRQKAIDLIHAAELVVMRAGNSPGLIWELKTVMDEAPPNKLICIVLNRKDKDFKMFEESLEDLLEERTGKKVRIYEPQPKLSSWQKFREWVYPGKSRSFGKIIHFDSNWTPVVNPILDMSRKYILRSTQGRNLSPSLWDALQPAMKNANLVLRKPPMNWLLLILMIIFGLMILLVLVIEVFGL